MDPEDDLLDDTTTKYVSVIRDENGPLIDDPQAVADLIDALVVTEVTDFLCMCTGDAAAEFFDADGKLLTVVRLDVPNRSEWPRWPGLAHLADPARLSRWLKAHYDLPEAIGQ